MLLLLVLMRSLGASSIWPPAVVASIWPIFVTTSYFMTARGPWQAPSRLPSDATPRPLQPTSCSHTSQSPPSVYLMMSPALLFALLSPWTKFEKKKAFWLAIQVGPSL